MVTENLLGSSQCLLLTIIGLVIVDSKLVMTIQCFMVKENWCGRSTLVLTILLYGGWIPFVFSDLRFSQLCFDHSSNAFLEGLLTSCRGLELVVVEERNVIVFSCDNFLFQHKCAIQNDLVVVVLNWLFWFSLRNRIVTFFLPWKFDSLLMVLYFQNNIISWSWGEFRNNVVAVFWWL